MPAIEVRDLCRTYRTTTGFFRRGALDVEAVRGITFDVDHGELFGLLGPNGAGKTTTIKMLITLLLPTAGAARVLGYDVVEDAYEVRKRVGYVFGGDRGLYDRLSALDNLRYFAELYGVPPRDQKRRICELPEVVLNEVRRVAGVRSVAVEERDQAQVIVVSVEPGEEVTPALLAPLNGTNVGRVAVREPTLEDAYVALVAEE